MSALVEVNMLDEEYRPFFREDHRLFRDQVRSFLEREIEPHHEQWERDGVVSREAWLKAGAAGILCSSVTDEYEGPGGDYLHNAVVIEEMAYAGVSGPGFWIHSEMVVPYVETFGTAVQKSRWLPHLVSGEAIGAVGMSEPGAGSDLRGIATLAVRVPEGWRIRGQKVFISNGQLADLVVLAAKTSPKERSSRSLSLFLVDTSLPGFRRGKNLDKLGYHAQDTSELFFDDLIVPEDALLGNEGDGFSQLIHGLARERISIAVSCQAKAEYAYRQTLAYVKERKLFGRGLGEFQNTRFRLADLRTEIAVGRAYVDQMLVRYIEGGLDAESAALAKLWTTEMLGRVVDACLQLHGGWGYMREFPIARAYADARVERIAGGSSEVLREIIGRAVVGGER